MFHRGFLQVQPGLYLGGHYRRHIDELVIYTAGDQGHPIFDSILTTAVSVAVSRAATVLALLADSQ